MALEETLQGGPAEVRDRGPKGVEAVVQGSSVCRRNATHIASSSGLGTEERTCFGPIRASSTVVRLRHFRTVLSLRP